MAVSFFAHILAFVFGAQLYVLLVQRHRQLVAAARVEAVASERANVVQIYSDAFGAPIPFAPPLDELDDGVAALGAQTCAPIVAYDCAGRPFALAVPIAPGELDPLLATGRATSARRRARTSSLARGSSQEGMARVPRNVSAQSLTGLGTSCQTAQSKSPENSIWTCTSDA